MGPGDKPERVKVIRGCRKDYLLPALKRDFLNNRGRNASRGRQEDVAIEELPFQG